jgi:hypothetical protein
MNYGLSCSSGRGGQNRGGGRDRYGGDRRTQWSTEPTSTIVIHGLSDVTTQASVKKM